MPKLKISLLAVLFALTSIAALAQAEPSATARPEQTPHLVVVSAQPDEARIVLHVEGRNFCELPSVTLGGTPLTIANATATSFDALLPVGIQPGESLLEVTCGKGAVRNDTFLVIIP
jgi:hypothetical protein